MTPESFETCPNCNYKDRTPLTAEKSCRNCGWKPGFPLTYFVFIGKARVMRIYANDLDEANQKAAYEMSKSNRRSMGEWHVEKS